MTTIKYNSVVGAGARAGVFFSIVVALPMSYAATLWTGPDIEFTQSATTPSDIVLPGVVVLTRGVNDVLYNTVLESSPGSSSPLDTEWALGTLANYSSLSYQSLDSMRNGDLAAVILEQAMVMHIISADVYLSVEFTAWGQNHSGGFAYTRSTPPVTTPTPTVNLTQPSPGATFAAPASLVLTAAASGGTVTNVEFFAGTNLLGQTSAPPFSVVANIPSPGAYLLTAVATAAGVSGTSSVVNITVVAPVAVSLSAPSAGGGSLSFSYTANSGLSYVIQTSSNLVDWVSVATNAASSNLVAFSQALTAQSSGYFRVGRLLNP